MADLAGRTVLVCGVGVAGTSAARTLLARGARVLLTAAAESDAVEPLVAAGARWSGVLTGVPDGVDLVVPSPGLRPDDPILRAAAGAGVPVWGEAELAWQLRGAGAAPWLAITGTNGKTTTVHMLESILRAAGLAAVAVGNVGVPMIDAVTGPERFDVLAVELSSQQLHFAPSIRPEAAVLLNLAPDHLNWHGSMAAYTAAKARIWSGPVAVGNADDPAVTQLLAAAGSERKLTFTLSHPARGQFGLAGAGAGAVLVDNASGDGPVDLVAADQVHPAGEHNVANALAAAALARIHGVSPDAVAAGLRGFVPDPHRNQLVAERDGVRWVDDSKATNPHAARASLRAYPSLVWIAGGQFKDAPVDDLVAQVAPRLRGVVLLGAERDRVAAALRRHAPDVPVIDVATRDDGAMIDVVRAAAGLARPGDTVLLAPAAASYDMFTGYAARGDAFAAAVRDLSG